MSELNLDAFLAAQLSEGESQGEGDFTISHEKAAQKMSQYSLPRAHAWVLKLVQAAVSWECRELLVTQTRTESTFHFVHSSPSGFPSTKELVTSIVRADPEHIGALENFGAALRVLVEKAHLSFHLQVNDGVGEPQALYAGVFYGEMSEEQRRKQRRDWGPGLTLAIQHVAHTEANRLLLNRIPIRQHGLPMLLEMERYAYVSPIAITVDGRRLDGVHRSGAFRWSYHHKPLRIAGVDMPGEHPLLPICEGFDNQVFSVHTPFSSVWASAPSSPLRELYFLLSAEVRNDFGETAESTRRAELLWVRDGVIVDQQTLSVRSCYLNLRIYASAEGLRPDLTGFHLVQDEEFQARKQLILERMAAVMLLELRAKRDVLAREEAESEGVSPESESSGEPEDVLSEVRENFRKKRSAAQRFLKSMVRTRDKFQEGLAINARQSSSLADRFFSGAVHAFQEGLLGAPPWENHPFKDRYAAELELLSENLEGQPAKVEEEPVDAQRVAELRELQAQVKKSLANSDKWDEKISKLLEDYDCHQSEREKMAEIWEADRKNQRRQEPKNAEPQKTPKQTFTWTPPEER